jgi:hypothetical protein
MKITSTIFELVDIPKTDLIELAVESSEQT